MSEREFLAAVRDAKQFTETIEADLAGGARFQAAYSVFLDSLAEAEHAAAPPVDVTRQAAAWARGVAAQRAWLAVSGQAAFIANYA